MGAVEQRMVIKFFITTYHNSSFKYLFPFFKSIPIDINLLVSLFSCSLEIFWKCIFDWSYKIISTIYTTALMIRKFIPRRYLFIL